MKSIGEIIEGRLKVIEVIHKTQQELMDVNMHVSVILAMLQMCFLDADEGDLAEWMSFYMLKKLGVDSNSEINKVWKTMSEMSPDERRRMAKQALKDVANQREELLTKINKEKDR